MIPFFYIMIFFTIAESTLTDAEFKEIDMFIDVVGESHFALMFPVELIRTDLNDTFDPKQVYDIFDELAEERKEFQIVKELDIPEFVAEPLYDRLTYLSVKLDNGYTVNLANEIAIIQDIIQIAAESDNIKLDFTALLRVKEELRVDMAAVSKLKLFKTCLLSNLFPFMQEECEGLLRQKLIEHLKIWIEVWKRHQDD
ncbi:uncharacterized protein KLLA0_D09416g [Kluyveromyces lactis]|uniref:KLLA0D09416p n=1 Tax=Kluyveromyces lactis (strain ATCC 8585 / CBS 2359 / DSM 70799 / NBRC 1267 / NRRL Y-1140 / WM37) TaxID=284590 RepID=Q6CRF8_KLULA|nr:uncharacterized protein KLLA0_D09416g [Kluyveromyces lactis]CAH00577.1 KLLA0D09416p [Kluyveromyces lactis]|eukprot:XP_453481.1 uncharacterized protein KLLA0_D09416g [Kluyveromyces lactis]